ncbi:MAG: SUF system Fe-S cluster assembly regulator [Novosphingobium sp.]|nr:SUF system Fe-S cluster assembly regulator [Novosphingobium sp.]
MRLSSMADYAVVIMAAASRHCGSGLRDSRESAGRSRLSAGQLAEETGLPAPTVQKLVSRLSAAGLLHSTRGVGGGLRLARPAAAISLADIVEAVEGPIAMTACLEEARHDCSLEDACSVRGHWPVVNEALRGALAGVSLSSLAEAGR